MIDLLVETYYRLPIARDRVVVTRSTGPKPRGYLIIGNDLTFYRVVSCRPAGALTYRLLCKPVRG